MVFTISPPFCLRASTLHISRALAIFCLAAPCVAAQQEPVNLSTVVVTAKTPETLQPNETAPSQGRLEARSAQSVVSDYFIRNFTSAVADYTQAVTMTPGAFAYSPNGVGLSDSKITIRGLSDSYSVMTFDSIPFNDTNGVSHHSWVWFPTQFLGGVVVDRSPGSASSVGQATFGGSINLQSRVLEPERRTSVSYSAGSWNTRLVNLEHETGQFGSEGKSNLLVNVQKMKSDGYETYNRQDRQGLSAKFQHELTNATTLTLFGSYLDLKSNTPNIKGVSRANYDVGNYTYLLSADPARADYYGYNFYDVPTSFVYVGLNSRLGDGWVLEDKLYRYSYHNKQNYNSATKISATSATDKLNAYNTYGNLLKLVRESAMGSLRMGLWMDQADSHRYQIQSDPRTWVDAAAPNFNESYRTISMQPYVEHEFKLGDKLKITPGLKYASYRQDFLHQQDLGSGVGPLGGTINAAKTAITGGAGSVANNIRYSDWLPSLDVHYAIRPQWSVYAQLAEGDQIPSTTVFDVPYAKVNPAPKPTKAKTFQTGTVWNSADMTLAADVYYTKLDGAYTSYLDATGNTAWVFSGTQVNQGVEAEGSFALGRGLSVYANATFGSLKYANGQWVAGAPKDTETVALNYNQAAWAASLSMNRVGKMYNDGTTAANPTVHEAFTLNPVLLTNLFVNYTVKHLIGFDKETRFQLGVNNVFNRHDIVGIATPTANSSSAAPNAADLLTILPGRSLAFTATMSF